MSASQGMPGPDNGTQEQRIAERTRLRNVLKALQHALRSLPQYGKASPATERAVESLREAFRVVWKAHALLTVYFRDDGIWVATGAGTGARWSESERKKNALQHFRDAGFHSLTFHRGFEVRGLQPFLDVATHEYRSDALEDLATSLWFEDCDRLEFVLQESQVDGASRNVRTAPMTDTATASAGAPDDPPSIPEALLTQPLSLHEIQLTGQETTHLQELIAGELRRPVCADAVAALLDSLQTGAEPLRAEILARMDSLLPLLLERGYLEETAVLLQELRSMADVNQELGQGFCTALQRTLSLFERSDRVAQYLRELESGEIVPDLETLAAFIGVLGPANTRSLVRIAERSRSKPVAAILLEACEAAIDNDPDLLLDLLRSDDDLVLRGTLRLVTSSRSDEAVRETIRLLRHRDPRMRLVAAKSLISVGRPEALQALTASLADDCEDVRQTCVWALATWEYRPALEAIHDILQGPRLQEMVLTEKLAYFDAYARLGGETAVPYLSELVHARNLFRPRYERDLRVCAARGLAQIPGPEARQALEKAIDDRDPKVRRIVARQLREANS